MGTIGGDGGYIAFYEVRPSAAYVFPLLPMGVVSALSLLWKMIIIVAS